MVSLATLRDESHIKSEPSKGPTIKIESGVPPNSGAEFDLFTALTGRPDVFIELARHLTINSLVKLYSISRDFHDVVDCHMTTVVTYQAFSKCKDAACIFPYTTYKSLCVPDPSGRPNPDGGGAAVRLVPSFKWLRMVVFREGVVRRIMDEVNRYGHNLPNRTGLVLKKLWFMMDVAFNDKRSNLIRNERFWSNLDLFVATLFFVKLDMCFTDPLTGDGETHLRHLLLGQRTLSRLLKTLQRDGIVNQLELIQLYVGYTKGVLVGAEMDMFGVRKNDIGIQELEGWRLGESKLLRIDEVIMMEAARRGLDFDERYSHMMLWGYVNPVTLLHWERGKKRDPVGEETDGEDGEQ
ncbi:MAG: hypothetical protein M1840_006693 [Geoglossum simile]|nr:MAG: hypothetical protein M1840_006693 [Geoglossum simile]